MAGHNIILKQYIGGDDQGTEVLIIYLIPHSFLYNIYIYTIFYKHIFKQYLYTYAVVSTANATAPASAISVGEHFPGLE